MRGDEDLTSSLSRKTLALVGYLCASRGPHRRANLADLLCASADDPVGTLRWHLSRIRKVLGADVLETQRDIVALAFPEDKIDLTRFERTLSTFLTEHTDEQLDDALSLYRGELLEGLKINDAAEFDLWLLSERNRLKMLYEQGLQEKMNRQLREERLSQAIETGQLLLRSDPLREESHATLIWLYARLGQHEAAQRQYRQCAKLLEEELGVEPLEETQMLMRQVSEGDFRPELWTSGLRHLTHQHSIASATPHPLELSSAPAEEVKSRESWVGRKKACERFSQAWEGVKKGQTRLILVESPEGGGKTRFVEEMAARSQGVHLWKGSCYASEMSFPYHPWSEMLASLCADLTDAALEKIPRQALEQVARLLPALAYRLDLSLSPPPEGGFELESFCSAFHSFFALLPSSSSHWLFLDDIHWADEASLRLLHHLLRNNGHEPLCLVASVAPEEIEEDSPFQRWFRDVRRNDRLHRVNLPMLTQEEVFDWLSVEAPTLEEAQRTKAARLFFEATQGNPLYLQALLREWDQTEMQLAHIPMSSDLQELILRKLERCPTSARQVFEAMAVWETPLSLRQAQLASTRSEEEVIQALEDGSLLGLCRMLLGQEGSEPMYAIQSRVVQWALVGQLRDMREGLLHRRVALALEQTGGQVAKIAYHWEKAHNPSKVAYYAMLAGKHAAMCSAHGEALRFFEKALPHLEMPLHRTQVLRLRGEVEQRMGLMEEALASLEEAAQHARSLLSGEDARRERALCQLSLGRFAVVQGDLSHALELLESARLELSALGEVVRVCGLWGEIGRVYRLRGELEHARKMFEEKLQYTEKIKESPTTQARLRSEALGALSSLFMQMGRLDEAHTAFEQMLEQTKVIAESQGDERLWGAAGSLTMSKVMVGAGAFAQDTYMSALGYLEAQLEQTLRSEGAPSVHRDLSNLSAMFTWVGDYGRAFGYLQKHFALAFAQQSLEGLSKVVGDMAELYRFLGEKEKAERCYSYRLALGLDLGERRSVATSLGRLAELMIEAKQLDEAQSLLTPALELCRKSHFSSDLCAFLCYQSELHQAQGATEQARERALEALQIARDGGLERWIQTAAILLQEADLALGRVSLEDAISQVQHWLEQQTAPQLQARLWDTLAQLHQKAAHTKESQDASSQAAAQYAALYQRAPSFRYAQRYKVLTGKELPSTIHAPELPEMLARHRKAPMRYLKRVQTLLSGE
ncbi:MAG: AAA family ATPase [Myxococcales bacterium]|nr:AAA family ATPase [Myxococcales bacterium]